jgi:hypothetical protein
MDIFCDKEIIENSKYISSLYGNYKILTLKRVFAESYHYGHIHSILEYSGCNLSDALYFPVVEHGVGIEYWIEEFKNISIAVTGRLRQSFIHMSFPDIPIFVLGPYIHYATPFYNNEQYAYLKKRWGKTLLIFPQHTYEMSSVEYDVDGFVNSILSGYAKLYDTVAVCLYWADFDTKLYELFRAHGVKIMCAGYRWDYCFLKRLKTIISLADAVITNAVGSHIGYCIHMDKPVKYIESDIVTIASDLVPRNENVLANYKTIKSALAHDMDLKAQKALLNPYCGDEEIKSKEEINDILDINRRIILMSKGFYSRSANAVKRLMCSNLSEKKKALLADAMSNSATHGS